MGRVRESRGRFKCTHTHAHTHRGDGAVYLWNLFVVLLRSVFMGLLPGQLKMSDHLSFYIFINFRVFVKLCFFFLLGSYLLKNLASLYLHTSLLSASSIIAMHLIVSYSPRFRKTRTAHIFLSLSNFGRLE